MKNITTGLLLAGLLAGATSDATQATGSLFFANERPRHFSFLQREKSFQRMGTLANYRNNANIADETISEIVAATADGKTLVYTDGALGTIGFIDITNPGNPQPRGTVILDPDPSDDTDYSPTSVDVLGNKYALVGANASESLTNTSGKLVVVDIASHGIVTEIDLGGQPDSVKISPDGKYVAIVIENERNENLCVGGTLDGTEADEDDCVDGGGALGVLPSDDPAGFLAVIKVDGTPPCGSAIASTSPGSPLCAGGSGAGVRGYQLAQRGGRDIAGEQPHRDRRSRDPHGY